MIMKSVSMIRISSLIMTISGIIGLIISFFLGTVDVYILLFIPIFKLSGFLPMISIFLLFAGVILLFISLSFGTFTFKDEGPDDHNRSYSGKEVRSEWGGLILIGPIPIIFGSRFSKLDRKVKITYISSVVAIVVLTALILLIFIG